MNKTVYGGILIAIVIAVIGCFLPVLPNHQSIAGSVSTACSGSTTCFTNLFLSDSLTVGTDNTSVAQFTGTTVLNNALFGVGAGSVSTAYTLSTAATTSLTMTPAQYCLLTGVLIPSSNTTTVTITFPNQAATAAACGGALPTGAWGFAWIDNESTSSVTLATSTGANMTFFHATGTPAGSIGYPPKIQPLTMAAITSFGAGSASTTLMIQQYSRPAGY